LQELGGRGLFEAILLGFASGPVCLGSCGPVLLPWLAAERSGFRGTARLLSLFLGGRLAGYLSFAVLAWAVGLTLPVEEHSRALVFGLANVGLAIALVLYVWLPQRHWVWRRKRPEPELHQIALKPRFRPPAAVILGLFTGLSLCPPFVAAGVRAAESRSLAASIVFFLLFFGGTAVWFVPALAISALRRIEPVAAVARMTMLVLAVYYAYLGVVSLSWRVLHA
jgi:sulfite exporter TauE/SafE